MEDLARRVTSPRVRALYEYWSAKRGDRRMPARAEIDPGEIRALLPYLLLTDVHQHPLRVFFRLVGTAVVEAAGRDLTGFWLHEAEVNGGPELWTQTYRRLVERREPVFGRARATLPRGGVRVFEWVMLPLSSDGETVDKTVELEDWEALRRMSDAQLEQSEWSVEVYD